jgi:hypothetical protein
MEVIKNAVEAEMDKTGPLFLGLAWESTESYGLWLKQTYNMVNYSTRLVALAGAWANLKSDFLHDRYVDHSREERGHPILCVRDLEHIGYTLDSFPVMYEAEAMYQCQYFWIMQREPASFFGYTLALETLAIKFCDEVYSRLCKAHGKKSATFLQLHSGADVGHLESAYKAIGRLNDDQIKITLENLKLSCEIYRGMLKKIKDAKNNLSLIAA